METNKIHKILAAVDFSDTSMNAVLAAVGICKSQFATLTLMHVVQANYDARHVNHDNHYGRGLTELIDVADEKLRKLAATIRTKQDIVISHVVQYGSPSDQIRQWAMRNRIDLIVVGRQRMSRIRGFFIGSLVVDLIKKSSCAVLSLPKEIKKLSLKKILFPVRIGVNAVEKYNFLRPILRRNKSRLFFAGILSDPDGEHQDRMTSLLAELQNKAFKDKVDYSSGFHSCSDVSEQVMLLAKQEKADLIVITPTVNDTWRELFPGGYLRGMANNGKYPVLSVPSA